MSDLYSRIVQEYLGYKKEQRDLIKERERIMAKLEVIDGILTDLNDALCKCGNHIYEHFEENKPQAEKEIANEFSNR